MSFLVDTLRSIVGAPHCLTADADMAPYLTDWRGRYTGRARAVVPPADTARLKENFSIQAMAEKTRKLYAELLQRG